MLGYNHRTITYTGVSQCFVESSFAKKHYQAPVEKYGCLGNNCCVLVVHSAA